MSKGIAKFLGLAVLLAGAASPVLAQGAAKGCIELKSTAEVEQTVVAANGEKSVKLVPADRVVPGTVVVWTITAHNVCKQASDNVSINNAVPEHMSFVANSATGAGSDITFSLDGKSFGTPEQLTVADNGTTRKARADEYRHVRWVFKAPLQPGTQVAASFRAVLN